MQPYSTPDAFLLLIPPTINVALFFLSAKLITGGIFSVNEMRYIIPIK